MRSGQTLEFLDCRWREGLNISYFSCRCRLASVCYSHKILAVSQNYIPFDQHFLFSNGIEGMRNLLSVCWHSEAQFLIPKCIIHPAGCSRACFNGYTDGRDELESESYVFSISDTQWMDAMEDWDWDDAALSQIAQEMNIPEHTLK